MKTRFILYITVVVVGVSIFVLFTKPKWSPNYCSQFSGFHSYAWYGNSERCVEAGCAVKKIEEKDDPNIFDDEGFTYRCVKK